MAQPQKSVQKISPFLWFDGTAEEAANFYVGIFPNSRITTATRYTKESAAVSGQPEGKLMTVGFLLDGQEFAAINGGPHFKFTEAISFVIHCASQDEVDHYWNGLCEGADAKAQQCGWLKDKFGVSWQVVPDEMFALMSDPDAAKAGRVAQALYQMKKIELAVLRKAYAG
jgi:predicted 3-demethylubiquinone-9 3-methyltransferase (glyoxalase superfamily)